MGATDYTSEKAELIIRWGNLDKYYADLETVGAQAGDIEKYAREQVFSKAGFDFPLCVLQPLADAMDAMGDVFGGLKEDFDSRWDGLVSALRMAAREIERVDDNHSNAYRRAGLDLGSH